MNANIRIVATTLLAGTIMHSGSAMAQPASNAADTAAAQAGDIIVTAQRREESLQQVPLAVTALGTAELATRNVTNLSDLATSVVPGLTVLPLGGNPGTLGVSIRGISTTDQIGLSDPGVAVYADGVPLGRSAGLGVDLADIQRVEILRGPQGTLFGRNAEGGAIQYVSRRPTGKLGGHVEGEFGNFGEHRIVGRLDLPRFGDFSLKLSGLYQDHDGYVKNRQPGAFDSTATNYLDFGMNRQWGVRAALLWQPAANFSAYYTFDYSKTRFTNTYTLRTGGPAPVEAGFCAVPAFAAICATPATFIANLYRGTQPAQPDRPEMASLITPQNFNRTRTYGQSLVLKWDASDALTLNSITGVRALDETASNNFSGAIVFIQFVPNSAFDGVGADVPAGTLAALTGAQSAYVIRQRQFSQELQATGKLGRLEYTGGLFYFRETMLDTRTNPFSIGYLTGATPGVLQPIGLTPFELSPSKQQFRARGESFAAYLQTTWTPPAFDDRLKLTVGLRYTHDKKTHTRLVFNGVSDNTRANDFSEGRVDPAFVIAYQLNNDINIYARYSTAYRSGGVQIRNQVALNTYDPEENKAFELGFKALMFDRKVRFNVAAYRSVVKGYQTTQVNSATNPSSTATVNLAQDLKFTGVETELSWQVTEQLRLAGSYAYSDAKAPAFISTLTGGTVAFQTPASPRHQVYVAGDYTMTLGGRMAIGLHADYNYMSTYALQASVPLTSQTAPMRLSTANARLTLSGLALGGANATISGWVKNLFDSSDYAYAFGVNTSDPAQIARGGAANMIPPRTYGINVSVDF